MKGLKPESHWKKYKGESKYKGKENERAGKKDGLKNNMLKSEKSENVYCSLRMWHKSP